ncbi:helix-turn-helix transcriptional regulator [Larkinella bovis]|uniref:Helix-turn-helix transcriptional regulator n=1 Tax=Larkinella bovis TaxID=683041 RepID=A0ABW0I8K9_9BACT
MEPREVVKRLLDVKGITNRDLAMRVEIAEQSISKMLNGTRALTDKTLVRISQAIDIPFDTLRWGQNLEYYLSKGGIDNKEEVLKGEIKRLYGSSFTFAEIPFVSKQSWSSFKEKVQEVARQYLDDELLQIAPGPSARSNHDSLYKHTYDFYELYNSLEEYYPVILKNNDQDELHIDIAFEMMDSFMGPTVNEGGTVLTRQIVDREVEVINDGVYVVAFADQIVIKRIKANKLRHNDRTIVLYGDNERAGEIVIPRHDIHFIWKVLEVHQRVK